MRPFGVILTQILMWQTGNICKEKLILTAKSLQGLSVLWEQLSTNTHSILCPNQTPCCGAASTLLALSNHLGRFQRPAACSESSQSGMGGAGHWMLEWWFWKSAKFGNPCDGVIDLEAPDIWGLRLPKWPVFCLSLSFSRVEGPGSRTEMCGAAWTPRVWASLLLWLCRHHHTPGPEPRVECHNGERQAPWNKKRAAYLFWVLLPKQEVSEPQGGGGGGWGELVCGHKKAKGQEGSVLADSFKRKISEANAHMGILLLERVFC